MKVLIAGGSGFLGTALKDSLIKDHHDVFILTRHASMNPNQIHWDGKTTNGWEPLINEMDAVVNLTGFGLEHWPWTKRQKQRFVDSRVQPGRALASAIQSAARRPRVFLQTSGINRYGLRGEGIADESTPAADDFLAQLTVQWEDSTKPVEELGVRRVIARNAVVLARNDGLFPLMALAPRLFFGGKFGDGKQAMPWIHIADQTRAMRFLLENEDAQGPFNLISPELASNAEFMRAVTKALHRPYWFHIPKFLLRLFLGEMSILLTDGRYSQPKRLIELGFQFQFSKLINAMEDLLIRKST
ncbi:MAG TPA: TIGR01777 family oxidoreductase [Anaerolineales bacterium]|nr:TIGR01777 family oxidoreductase [Anaerolineales bacterium]